MFYYLFFYLNLYTYSGWKWRQVIRLQILVRISSHHSTVFKHHHLVSTIQSLVNFTERYVTTRFWQQLFCATGARNTKRETCVRGGGRENCERLDPTKPDVPLPPCPATPQTRIEVSQVSVRASALCLTAAATGHKK